MSVSSLNILLLKNANRQLHLQQVIIFFAVVKSKNPDNRLQEQISE